VTLGDCRKCCQQCLRRLARSRAAAEAGEVVDRGLDPAQDDALVRQPYAMTSPSLDDHRQRILQAADYIVANIARPLTVAEVARAAAMSEFHFHRVFAAVMEETVGEFTLRRRIELAALMLAYQPERSVTESALAAGYSSSANFSKGFAAYFGCRPTDVRKPEHAQDRRLGTGFRRAA